MNQKTAVAIVGATGHTGAELVRLLHFHPQIHIQAVTSTSHIGKALEELQPALKPYFRGVLQAFDVNSLRQQGVQVVFLCLPNGEASHVAQALWDAGLKIIDLSADFRFQNLATYEKSYGVHGSPALLKQAVYGLPEFYRSTLSGAKLVANPGCYVTAATLALKPLVEAEILEEQSIIVDAASGVSGSGRALKETNMAIYVQENFSAYAVLEHRHQPEIENNLGVPIIFTAHLLPVNRGILATCYAKVKPDISEAAIVAILRSAYEFEPFVDFRLAPFNPCLQDVVGSNRCAISFRYRVERRQLVVLAAIDNLIKGASGQAIQNMNVMLGLPEATGLDF